MKQHFASFEQLAGAWEKRLGASRELWSIEQWEELARFLFGELTNSQGRGEPQVQIGKPGSKPAAPESKRRGRPKKVRHLTEADFVEMLLLDPDPILESWRGARAAPKAAPKYSGAKILKAWWRTQWLARSAADRLDFFEHKRSEIGLNGTKVSDRAVAGAIIQHAFNDLSEQARKRQATLREPTDADKKSLAKALADNVSALRKPARA